MRRNFRFTLSVPLWRLVNVVTAIFVLAYIAFDVLDLDLSEFPTKHPTDQKTAIIAVAPMGTELVSFLSRDSFRIDPSLLNPSEFKESLRLQRNDMGRVLRLTLNLSHVHRITFPRSDTIDPSPA